MKRGSVVLASVGGSIALAASVIAANIHFVGTPLCATVGNVVCCEGKIAGLGTAPTNVQLSVPFGCENRGGNQPPGLASGQTGPIDPRGGQITFEVCASGRCPSRNMTPTFGSATLNVFQGSSLVFSGTIPVQ